MVQRVRLGGEHHRLVGDLALDLGVERLGGLDEVLGVVGRVVDDEGSRRFRPASGERRGGAEKPREQGAAVRGRRGRSEEHTSEAQTLMRTSYAVVCLKKKQITHTT